MAHPDLTSHHVNYLIWRYLQESGHGEAAVSLQRTWYRDPQTLPFAPYIRTHALVSLVQKGLQWHELESTVDENGNEIDYTPSHYFFGPEPFQASSLKPRAAASTDLAGPSGKVFNGHVIEPAPVAGKKNHKGDREINGEESMEVDEANEATESKAHTPTTEQMDGDGDVSMVAEYVPQESTTSFTLTNGTSVGVQVTPAKAADLAPHTAVLDVAADHVTRALWRPHDPTVVVAAGETFCSLWKLSVSSAPVSKQLFDLKGTTAVVSAVAWDATGEKLAVATYNDARGTITMYDVNGDVVDLLPEVPRIINGLNWATDGSQLVVVASDSRISELALWDDTQRPDVFPPPQMIDSPVYEVAWCGRNQLYACGDGAVYQCEVDNSIRLTKTFTPAEAKSWHFIRCVHTDSSSVAVAACSDEPTIWIPTHDIKIEDVHHAEITSIALRPQPQAQHQDTSLVVASFSMDGPVKVWQIDLESKQFKCLHHLFLGSPHPALAGGFSPDGYALAAASEDRLFIWNADRGGNAMATWAAPGSDEIKKEDSDRATNGQNGHADLAWDRGFSWDVDGKRLAYGFGHQMAIVNWQR